MLFSIQGVAEPSLRPADEGVCRYTICGAAQFRNEVSSFGARRRSAYALFRGGLRKKNFEDQQSRAHHDRAVRDVEGGPFIVAEIEEQEVGDVSGGDAVPEVADRAAQDECEPDAGRTDAVTVLPEQARRR